MSGANQSRAREQLQITKDRAKERAQEAAQRKANEAKAEFGRMAFDTLEGYFPEQARERRRRNRLQLLLVGAAIGFLLGQFLRRRSRTPP